MRRALLLVLVALAACLVPAAASAIIAIDIDAPGGKRLPIAVPEFVVTARDASLAKALSAEVAAALEMTGAFAVVPSDACPEPIVPRHFTGMPLSFPDWRLSGSEAVVIGNVTPAVAKDRAKGMISVEMRLYDATLGTMMVGKRYTGPAALYRRIAHKFSNDILYAFTGVRGTSDTEMPRIDLSGFRPAPASPPASPDVSRGGRRATARAAPELIAYVKAIHGKLRGSWVLIVPTEGRAVGRSMGTQIKIGIGKDGNVTHAKVEGSSGNRFFDESALRAVRKASPLPAPPEQIRGTEDYYDVTLRFLDPAVPR